MITAVIVLADNPEQVRTDLASLKRGSAEKYSIMRHGNGLLLINMNESDLRYFRARRQLKKVISVPQSVRSRLGLESMLTMENVSFGTGPVNYRGEIPDYYSRPRQ